MDLYFWSNVTCLEDEKERVKKYVFKKDDAVAEAVLYRYPDYKTRTVICCSTQAGCPVGCRFCGAGDAFVRSLTTEEIVEQVDYLISQTNVDPLNMGRLQVMFMSMGEPMLNLKHLIPALRILYAKYPNAALLVSTSAPDIGIQAWWDFTEISQEIGTIGLQFSVHESTDEA